MNDHEHDKPGAEVDGKRSYRSPVLTEYGSVEELVDSGVVGGVLVGIVPSVSKPPPSL